MIKVCLTQNSWLFSCIYASNYRSQRNILWENLKAIKNNYDGKWLVGRDFNEILKSIDKKGGRPINNARSADMWDWVIIVN